MKHEDNRMTLFVGYGMNHQKTIYRLVKMHSGKYYKRRTKADKELIISENKWDN